MPKLIGIVGWSTGDSSFGVSKPYLHHLKQYGEVIILTPNAVVPNLDLLVLPGGKDVVGGGKGDFSYYNSDGERFLEHFDRFTLQKYIEMGTPVWGTCRGFQTLCAHFGLPIVQELYGHGRSKDDNDDSVNKIMFGENYQDWAHANFKTPKNMKIGSWHHQGVTTDAIEDENSPLELIGYTADEGNRFTAEFMKHKTLPIAGAQGHVERDWNPIATLLIESLLKLEGSTPELFYGEENV